jgi:putative ABC transport system permease protein
MISFRVAGAIKQGLRSLAAHQLRTSLTTLGVVLGAGSVIIMLSVGEAARFQALEQLKDLGANTILLRSTKPADEPAQNQGVDMLAFGITYNDWERIRTTIPTVETVTPIREFRKVIRHREHKQETRIISVTADFLRQQHMEVAFGRWITPEDDRRFDNVIVLGSATAEVLFPTQNPIGHTVSIEAFDHPRSFVVIGVTEPKTLSTGNDGSDADLSHVAFIPFATDRVRFGREIITLKAGSFQLERLEVSQLIVSIDDVMNVQKTARAIRSVIDQFHPRKDVVTTVPLDLLLKAEQAQRMFTMILGAIAGISLVVGGIGIMNIMLSTVTERTREIGIRRALGARRSDIAVQFLVETLILSCGGGLLGIGLGIAVSYAVCGALELPTIIPLWSPIVAFAVAAIVGLVSGCYPARRAANLDPIEALRHE